MSQLEWYLGWAASDNRSLHFDTTAFAELIEVEGTQSEPVIWLVL